MPEPAASQTSPEALPPARPSPPPRGPGRVSRVAWWTGGVLLAVVSFCVTYGVLVFAGR
jgi:hypothetical protein